MSVVEVGSYDLAEAVFTVKEYSLNPVGPAELFRDSAGVQLTEGRGAAEWLIPARIQRGFEKIARGAGMDGIPHALQAANALSGLIPFRIVAASQSASGNCLQRMRAGAVACWGARPLR